MPIDRSDIEASLKKKGFKESGGDHNYFMYFTVDGQKTSVFTKTSHGSGYKTLSDNLVSAIAKQCGLTSQQFRELVSCPLSREKYESILVTNGKIKIAPVMPSSDVKPKRRG